MSVETVVVADAVAPVAVVESAIATVVDGMTPPAKKARKARNKTVSAFNLLQAILNANSTKTAEQIAAELSMEPQSFNQRLYQIRQDFRFDLITRKEFADLYPKNEAGEIEVENIEVEVAAVGTEGEKDYKPAYTYTVTATKELPAFLKLLDGRTEGSGSGRQAGDAMRDALRKLRAAETKVVDEV